MFVNFNNIFKEKPQSQQKVPQVLIDEMNRDLNDNLKDYLEFEALDDGACVLRQKDSSAGNITLNGLAYELTEEQKNILGTKPSSEDIAFYLYNSNDKIKLSPIEDGIILINGCQISLNQFFQKPLKGITGNVTEIFMSFPKTITTEIPITIGNNEQTKQLLIKHIPNKSISELKFESDPQNSLYISITFNIRTNLATFTFICNIYKAKSVKELCDNLVIYNAFRAGNGYFMDEPIEGNIELNDEDNQWADDAEQFWKKVLEIEKKLNVHFSIPDSLEDEDIYLVEELYQSLIMNMPTQARYKITSLTGKWTAKKNRISFDDLKGRPLTFDLVNTNEITLFDITTQLPVLTVISDALISATKKNNDETTIYLDETNPKQRNAIQYFTSMEELNNYRITQKLDYFQNAPLISDLLNEPSN